MKKSGKKSGQQVGHRALNLEIKIEHRSAVRYYHGTTGVAQVDKLNYPYIKM
jgi:hypothetical protein